MQHIRFPVPDSAKAQLDEQCKAHRRDSGLHFGQTAAAIFMIGLSVIRKQGHLSNFDIAKVRGMQ